MLRDTPICAAVVAVAYALTMPSYIQPGEYWLLFPLIFLLAAHVTVAEAMNVPWCVPLGIVSWLSGLGWEMCIGTLLLHNFVRLMLFRKGSQSDHLPRVVVITGAGSGIGRATCEALLDSHQDTILALDANPAGLASLKAWHDAQGQPGHLIRH